MYYARSTLWRRIKCKFIAPPLLNNYSDLIDLEKTDIKPWGSYVLWGLSTDLSADISVDCRSHMGSYIGRVLVVSRSRVYVDIGRYIDGHVERQSTEVDPCRWSVGEVKRPTIDRLSTDGV